MSLVSECLSLVEYDEFGRCLAIGEKEGLHTAFHEGINLLAHCFQASFVTAVEKEKAREFVGGFAVESYSEALGSRGFSGSWGPKEEHMGSRVRIFDHCLKYVGKLVGWENGRHIWGYSAEVV